MHPHVRACLATAALAALGGSAPARESLRVVGRAAPSPSASGAAAPARPPRCPSRSLPDGEGCVSFADGAASLGESPELTERRNTHHDRRGRLQTYDQIPRRPDRPASYDAFAYPIPTPAGEKLLVSGFDLDRPDDQQRRGHGLKAVGHGGVDLVARRGTEVRSLPLEHQEGEAEVIHVGPLFGTSVVTRHTVRESGRLRDYLVIHGHLDGAAPGLSRGARVKAGDLLGFVGDTGSEGLVHLHLEVRRVRDGIDTEKLPPGKIAANDRTVAVDPRNVLPLR
jgi:murein DD-endopeptidase MepM/ murein hydrolase activator NlpD